MGQIYDWALVSAANASPTTTNLEATSDPRKKINARASKFWNTSVGDNFEDAIQAGIFATLTDKNCSELLNEAEAKIKGYGSDFGDWIADFFDSEENPEDTGDKQPGWIKDTSEFICVTSASYIKVLDAFISNAMRLINMLLKKIDQLKEKLDTAIIKWTDEIINCILEAITRVRLVLDIKISDITNLDDFIKILDSCKCLKPFLREIIVTPFLSKSIRDRLNACFGSENDKGIFIYNSGQSIVDCLVNFFSFDSWTTLKDALDAQIQKIKNQIIAFGEGLKKIILLIIEVVMLPYRWLVQKYFNLISKQSDKFHIMLKAMGGFRCLFVYDKNSDGKYTMSILNILESYKAFITCLDTLCMTFSDELKLKVLDYNEKLRMDTGYWLDPSIADIYLTLFYLNSKKNYPNPREIRKLYSKGKRMSIDAVTKSMGDMFEAFIDKDTSGEEDIIPKDEDTTGEVETTLFNGEPSREEVIIEGEYVTEEIEIITETNLDTMIQTMVQNKSAQFVYDSYIELMEYLSKFKKTQYTLDLMRTSRNEIQSGDLGKDVDDTELIEMVKLPKIPSYELYDDYSEIDTVDKPKREETETESELYARWFDLAKGTTTT